MLNFIFFVTMYPILFLMWYIIRSAAKSRRHTLFGISISDEWLAKEEREAFEREFRQKQNRFLLFLAVFPIITIFIPWFSISLTLWMIWLMAMMILLILPYFQGNRKLLALKQTRLIEGLRKEDTPYADAFSGKTSAPQYCGTGFRSLRWYDFPGPLAFSALIAIGSVGFFCEKQEKVLGISILIFALCTLLFFVCALFTDRAQVRAVSDSQKINEEYARESRELWRRYWILAAWFNTVITGIFAVIMYLFTFTNLFAVGAVLWFSILYCLLLTGLTFRVVAKRQKLEERYQEWAGKNSASEAAKSCNDEAAWIGGIFYYNKADKHTMAANKLGSGYTMNLATRTGKVWAVIACLALLSIPIFCVWALLEEFTPISLSVSDNRLTAVHLHADYEIAAADITDISLIEELPSLRRSSGTDMDNLLKGSFRSSEDGKVKVFLNPSHELFLKITTADHIYYMSGYDDAETLSVYKALSR